MATGRQQLATSSGGGTLRLEYSISPHRKQIGTFADDGAAGARVT
jgi:hypothetical protein